MTPAQRVTYTGSVLQLHKACLAYDFLGSATSDDTPDDQRTAHVPTEWRDTLADPRTLTLFFAMYQHAVAENHGTSAAVLACLVQYASVRRALFPNAQRLEYITRMVGFINGVFRSQCGLHAPDNYHQLCRLLARFKTNFQLSDLVRAEGYAACVELTAAFTVHSLAQWRWAANSLHYLLTLWERLVVSMPYVTCDQPHHIDKFGPQITEAYIRSRVASVEAVEREGAESPLDDLDEVRAQMRMFSVIARCEFAVCSGLLLGIFDPVASEFAAMLAAPPGSVDPVLFRIREGQLTWLVFMVASVLGGRRTNSPSEAHDALDAELVARVFKLVRLLDARLASDGGGGGGVSERLELAVLEFLNQYRACFIGETVNSRYSKLYGVLRAALGLEDESAVVAFVLSKVVTNLQGWAGSEAVVERTVALFSGLCTGYTTLRRLLKLDVMQALLAHHGDDALLFLARCRDPRLRTRYYEALARVVASDVSEENTAVLERFLVPFDATLTAAAGVFLNGPLPADKHEPAKRMLIALARDIRGVFASLTSKASHAMVFHWMFPTFFDVLHRGLGYWPADPAVTTAVLKCLHELATDRNTRVLASPASPNGILLFKQVSAICCTFVAHASQLTGLPPGQQYSHKYKGVAVFYNIFYKVLTGGYLNFGVFRLYGDQALDLMFASFFRLAVDTPLADLLALPKLHKAYYALLNQATTDHMGYLCGLAPPAFRHVMLSLLEGVRSVETNTGTMACATLDRIFTFAHGALVRPRRFGHSTHAEAVALTALMTDAAPVFQELLRTFLAQLLHEDCKALWSISRPLLGLAVLYPAVFDAVRADLLATLPPARQGHAAACFAALLSDLDQSLSPSNRDKFTEHVTVFKRDISGWPASLAAAGASTTGPGGEVMM